MICNASNWNVCTSFRAPSGENRWTTATPKRPWPCCHPLHSAATLFSSNRQSKLTMKRPAGRLCRGALEPYRLGSHVHRREVSSELSTAGTTQQFFPTTFKCANCLALSKTKKPYRFWKEKSNVLEALSMVEQKLWINTVSNRTNRLCTCLIQYLILARRLVYRYSCWFESDRILQTQQDTTCGVVAWKISAREMGKAVYGSRQISAAKKIGEDGSFIVPGKLKRR